MGLQVALVHYIKSVAIAQLIKIRVIRIVGSTDSVDIGLLHQIQILHKPFSRHCPTVVGVKVMTVNAPNHKRHTVEQNLFADNLYLFEAKVVCLYGNEAVALLNNHYESVEIGLLGGPLLRIFYQSGYRQLACTVCLNSCNGLSQRCLLVRVGNHVGSHGDLFYRVGIVLYKNIQGQI